MPKEYSMKRLVQFSETDMAGVMYFANFFRIMEEIEHAYWRSLGFSVQMRDGDDEVGWPRVSVSCKFFAPVHFEDELDLRLKVVDVGVKSFTYEVEFYRGETRIAIGRAKAARCAVKDGAFRSLEIPERIRKAIEAPE